MSGNIFFTVMEHWHRFSREVEEFASREIIKNHLDTVLGNLV